MTNHGHKGDACRVLKPGETFVLAECEGVGMIQQMWFTYDKYNDPSRIRTLRLEIFWDGEETPAVSLQQMGGGEFTRIRRLMSRNANIKVVRTEDFAGNIKLEDELDVSDPDLNFCIFLREDYLSSVAYLYLDRPAL